MVLAFLWRFNSHKREDEHALSFSESFIFLNCDTIGFWLYAIISLSYNNNDTVDWERYRRLFYVGHFHSPNHSNQHVHSNIRAKQNTHSNICSTFSYSIYAQALGKKSIGLVRCGGTKFSEFELMKHEKFFNELLKFIHIHFLWYRDASPIYSGQMETFQRRHVVLYLFLCLYTTCLGNITII